MAEGRRALQAMVTRGRARLRARRWAVARDRRWRISPIEQFAQGEIARLEEARLGALEDRIDADLMLGQHRGVVGELEALVGLHPHRERLLGQLMLALYRSRRHADALDAYRRGRQALGEELGLEPGPELRALEQRILTHDLALDPPTPTAPCAAARSALTGDARAGADRRRWCAAAGGGDRSGPRRAHGWRGHRAAGGAELGGGDRHPYEPCRRAGRGGRAAERDRVWLWVALGREPR